MSRDTILQLALSVLVVGSLIVWAARSGLWTFAIILALVAPFAISGALLKRAQHTASESPQNTGAAANLQRVEELHHGVQTFFGRVGGGLLRGLAIFGGIALLAYLLHLTGRSGLSGPSIALVVLGLPVCLVIYPLVRVIRLYAVDSRSTAAN
jgi:hypothetical protein